MSRKIAPSVAKAQEITALRQGHTTAESGEALVSIFVQLATERVLQETLEQEQAEVLGRGRDERQAAPRG